jgi:hypothetical protein
MNFLRSSTYIYYYIRLPKISERVKRYKSLKEILKGIGNNNNI